MKAKLCRGYGMLHVGLERKLCPELFLLTFGLTMSVTAGMTFALPVAASNQDGAGSDLTTATCEPNGCGGNGWDFCKYLGQLRPKCEFYRSVFAEDCNRHDQCYAQCCCRMWDYTCKYYHKYDCDWNFLASMKSTCDGRFTGWQRAECYAAAGAFFAGVRGGGWMFHEIGCVTCRQGCPTGPGGNEGAGPEGAAPSSDMVRTCEFCGLEGINPESPDTDEDGIPDELEIAFGLDPLDPSDVAADPDGDGLINHDEVLFGFSPFAADTDGDGVKDRKELRRSIKQQRQRTPEQS